MTALLEAVKDLLEFGFGWMWPKTVSNSLGDVSTVETLPLILNAPETKVAIPEVSLTTGAGTALMATKAFVSVREVRVWLRPVITFDGEMVHLPYATTLELLGFEGRFAHVRKDDLVGWVLKDEVTTIVSEIFPEFNTGEIYSANHPETKKIRTLLKDEFAAKELYLPLQDVELVSYELQQKGKRIPWDLTRPRLAGSWQNLLKGKLTVTIGISPKTGSIIEFVHNDGTGFVGYVEAVSVDETITFSGIGRLIAGEYRQEVIPKVVWQEWRPVFIQLI